MKYEILQNRWWWRTWIAKNTEHPRKNGGSNNTHELIINGAKKKISKMKKANDATNKRHLPPTALLLWTANLFSLLYKCTLKSLGTSLKDGILYVPGPRVKSWPGRTHGWSLSPIRNKKQFTMNWQIGSVSDRYPKLILPWCTIRIPTKVFRKVILKKKKIKKHALPWNCYYQMTNCQPGQMLPQFGQYQLRG